MIRTLLARISQGHRTMRLAGRPGARAARAFPRPPVDRRDPLPRGLPRLRRRLPHRGDLAPGGEAGDRPRPLPLLPRVRGGLPREGDLVHARPPPRGAVARDDLDFEGAALPLAKALDAKLLSLFGRSLKLRQVSAGGCNACEADVNVLSTIGWDLGRFGIQVVASPRHADGLLITGPVTRNMELALKKTWDAVPPPKIVIAVGACAISGGPYYDRPEQLGGAASVVPVDLFVPGCPPHPLTILDGLLRLLGKLEEEGRVPSR